MTNLIALVYVSSARQRIAREQLNSLMQRSHERNEREAVTGVLLYHDGCFMQYLEGPASAVARVYSSIAADPLHTGVLELIREPITARQFGEWPLAFHAVDGSDLTYPTPKKELLLERITAASATAGAMLLSTFGITNQRRRHRQTQTDR